jgi:hypothetical protein
MSYDTKPWERRDDESATAYRAFEIYRDMGVSRSLVKAWARYADEKGLNGVRDRPVTAFAKWSVGNEWVARADAFDRHESTARLAIREQIRDETRKVLLDAAPGVARRLIEVALGMQQAQSHEVKAAQEVLDRAGITVIKDVNLAIADKPASVDRWQEILSGIDGLDARELAAIYRDAVKESGDA